MDLGVEWARFVWTPLRERAGKRFLARLDCEENGVG